MMLCSFSEVFGQASSVLSTGTWYKLAVLETGIYQIDYQLLKQMGIDPDAVSPDRIQIYGNGGAMLPQRNDAARAVDLTENAILVSGQEDGRFDTNDMIYFYAEGPAVIDYDSVKANLFHQLNTYSDTSYYFLRVGETKGLRIKSQASMPVAKPDLITQFDDYWFHEEESVNLLRSGRVWFGEYLATSSVSTFQATLPGIVPQSGITLFTSSIAAAQVTTRFSWKVNGQQVADEPVGVLSTDPYERRGLRIEGKYNLKAPASPGASTDIAVSYDKGGQSAAQAYLNYTALQVKRELKPYENQQIYRFLPGKTDTVSYQIKNITGGWQWWNVTKESDPAMVSFGNDGIISETGGKKLRKFIGFTPAQAYKPVAWKRVPNQNLHSVQPPDLLIVSARQFAQEARRLAEFREEHDNLETQVVIIDEIYNEFSSGKTDLTAVRDFVRMLYLRNPAKLKYVLLFGDATYDYRNRLKNQSQEQRDSWIPVYESLESLNPVSTFSSDDYVGFTENSEGEWAESFDNNHVLKLGIGRLPVKSVAEARVMVDKLIHYASSESTLGAWRNRVHFVADDGDGNVHQDQADALARLVQTEMLPKRIFLDAFPQVISSNGKKAVGANMAIKSAVSDGTLILNYTGHGGTSGWAEEQILTLSEIQSARGYNNMPLLITATCDFGRYDDPGLVSGGELMVLSPRGAAIGAITTTRPVFSQSNFLINTAFYESLIRLGRNARIGDILKETKNNGMAGVYNRNFSLLGDPSMQLARGRQEIRWVEKPDTLRALQKVSLKGAVFKSDGKETDAGFNGVARVTIFDKQVGFKTMGDEEKVKEYQEFSSKLFEGSVSVKNGRFTCEFVMPKDIDYRSGLGRASVYAVRSDSLADAAGQLDLKVGGSVAQVIDTDPPKITAYMNTASFKDGDIVDGNSQLFLKISDQSGINISKAGIGHDIVLTLNDTLRIILNDYYIADTDQYASGNIRYPFDNLPAGNYTLRIKVWDTYNNSSEIAFGFQVGLLRGIKLSLSKIYPNPFDQAFSFELNHNRADEDIEVVLNLFLRTGQQLATFKWQYYNSEPIIRETISSLHLKSLITPGDQYIYSLQIRSLKDNSVDRYSGKLSRLP